MAGFEFVAPVKPAPPAPMVQVAPESTATTPFDPIVMTPASVPSTISAAPVANAAPVDIGTMAIPLTPIVRESDALVVDSHAASSPSAIAPIDSAVFAPADNWPPEQDVQGFGRDVPLVLALQQIAPPQYRYSFDHGVDPGMRISWAGGKLWKEVVADIARDNSLNVDVVSNVIAFRRRSPMDIVSDQMADIDRSPDTVMGMPLKTLGGAPAVSADVAQPLQLPRGLSGNAPAVPVSPVMAGPVSAPAMPDPVADAPVSGITGVPLVLDDVAIAAKKRATAETKIPMASDDIPAEAVTARKKILVAEETPTRYSTNPMEIVLGGNPVPTLSDAPPGVAVPVEAVVEGGPAAPPKPPAPVDLSAVSEWYGRKNMTLHEVLGEWTSRAGVSLVWSSQYDYPLQTDVRIQGALTDAVRTMLAGFSKASPRPIGRLFKNKKVGAQPVLVVETQRLTN